MSSRRWSPALGLGVLVAVVVAPIAGCSKREWPRDLSQLDHGWPIPAAEGAALRALVAASTLKPADFRIWRRDANPALRGGSGAIVDHGHVVGITLAKTGLKRLDPVASLDQLEELYLEGNQLTALRGVGKLKKLRRLDVSRNPLQRSDDLRGLKSLRFLTLIDTGLPSLERLGRLPARCGLGLGGKLPKLRVVAGGGPRHLAFYDVAALPASCDLSSFTALRGIRLHKPRSTLSLTTLCRAPQLRELDLYKPQHRDLAGLAGCKRLEKLQLIFAEKLELATLPSLPKLKRLEVLESPVGEVALPALPALEELRLGMRNSYLRSLAGLRGERLPALRRLTLRRTLLERLDMRGRFPALRELTISYGPLRTLRGLGRAFPALERLKVEHTKLAQLGGELAQPLRSPGPAEAPAKPRRRTKPTKLTSQPTSHPTGMLTKLTSIDAEQNAIASLVGLAAAAPALRTLKLSRNRLTTLRGLEGAKALRRLEVKYNRLTSLAALRGLPIVHVDAFTNKLESAAPLVVAGRGVHESVMFYDLRANPLKDIAKSMHYYSRYGRRRSSSGGYRGSSRYSGGGGYRSGK